MSGHLDCQCFTCSKTNAESLQDTSEILKRVGVASMPDTVLRNHAHNLRMMLDLYIREIFKSGPLDDKGRKNCDACVLALVGIKLELERRIEAARVADLSPTEIAKIAAAPHN